MSNFISFKKSDRLELKDLNVSGDLPSERNVIKNVASFLHAIINIKT